MDWNAIGAIGEILGALGAIAALVYLGLQLRLNTRALDRSERSVRAATSFEGAHSWAEINAQLMQDKELAMLAARSFDPHLQEFSQEDSVRLMFLGRSTMERLDGLHYLNQNGQLDGELWNVRLAWARRWIDTPFWRAWWVTERHTLNYSASFIAELEREQADSGPVF